MIILLGKEKELQNINLKRYVKTNNVIKLDLAKKDLDLVIEEAESQDLFAIDKKTIIVKNWSFLDNGKSSYKKDYIIDFFKNASQDMDVIMLSNSDKETKTIKELSKHFEVIPNFQFGAYEKKTMIMSLLRKNNINISNDAIAEWVKISANSPTNLKNQIEKLILMGKDLIDIQDIQDNLISYSSESVFIPSMAKSIARGKYDGLIEKYNILKNNGWHDVVIISALTKSLIKEKNRMYSYGKQDKDTINMINDMIKKLLDLDLKIKQSKIDSKIGMEIMLSKQKEIEWKK